MLTANANEVLAYLQANWGWAAGLAASMFGLTALAGLLNRHRKDEVALWLMGAQTEAGWARSFVTLFDAVFDHRHLSTRCFLRSAAASLVAVVVIWLLMGSAEAIGLRLGTELTLGSLLILGLAINVVADYVSLLETRWLLGHMPRRTLAQAGVLLLDLLISAAIIWLAIFAFLRSPLHQGEIESFAEILGVFSIFSVFFYSTFLTSVWTWAYIASTWLMRLFTRLRLAHWLDVEHRPILILSHVLALVTFFGALALSGPLTRDEQGLTTADRTLCMVFKGRVCLDVAALTPTEQAQLDFITLACEGGVTEECFQRGLAAWSLDAPRAARLLRAGCSGGSAVSCSNLGILQHHGIGVSADPVEAARLYRTGCEGGVPDACNNLGYLYQHGIGIASDPAAAVALYRESCDAGHPPGCTNLGYSHEYGLGTKLDPAEAVRLYRLACDRGNGMGCTNLGALSQQGIGIDADPAEAARLYRMGCDGGDARGCSNLGVLRQQGVGVARDPAEAARLYRRGCKGGHVQGCVNLGYLVENGIGADQDVNEAARLYRTGCEARNAQGCVNLGVLHENGIGVGHDVLEALRLYRMGCRLGSPTACDWAAELAQDGASLPPPVD